MRSFRKSCDIAFGANIENKTQRIINQHFNASVAKTNAMHCFDFFDASTNSYYELKSRRNTSTKYYDTIVGYNKLEYIQQHPNNV